jgi:hypothetical protein
VPDLILVAWYLDNRLVADRPPDVLKAFLILQELCPGIGLRLSFKKTTFWRPPLCRNQTPPDFNISDLGIPEIKDDGFILLGAPVGLPAFCIQAVKNRVGKCASLMDKLHTLEDTQIQFGLLRSCFGFPKFPHCLRSCDPNTMKDAYEAFDESQCRAVSDCIGAQVCVDDNQWLQASLPVSMGGLGIRSAVAHSSAAFVASSLQTEDLVHKLLGNGVKPRDTTTALILLTNATTPLDFPLSATTATQKALCRRVDESHLFRLVEVTTDTRPKALLSSVQLKHTGDFLNVVPFPQLGLKLQATEFRLASVLSGYASLPT